MPIRTYIFRGQAFAPTGNVSVVALFNGVEVQNGPIPTIASTPPDANAEMDPLWQAELDTSVTGNVNLSIQVQGGTLFFGGLLANYGGNTPPTLPKDQWGLPYSVTEESDGKTNCMINGEPEYSRIPTPDPDTDGEWQYSIPAGSTFTCSIYIDPDLIYTTW